MADLLERADIGAIWLLILFILVIALLDIIIPGVVPKWAIFAPIFIPLFLRLDVAPQTVLAAYRVGDSPMNVITPLMVYLPLIVVVAQRYKRDAGIGTVISLMLPYTSSSCRSSGRCSSSSGTCSASRSARATRSIYEVIRRRGTSRAPVSDTTITFLILGAIVAVFVWDKLPVAIVAIGVALSLWATGVLTLEQSLAGFGDPSRAFIASLFVVSEALDASGVTGRLGQQLVGVDRRQPNARYSC